MKDSIINTLCTIMIIIYVLILPTSIVENFLKDETAKKICIYICVIGFILMWIIDLIGLVILMIKS